MRRATQILTQLHTQIRISIHALHEESDSSVLLMRSNCVLFQSTLSMRRATCVRRMMICLLSFQSTLSMRRATQDVKVTPGTMIFQSTLSMRRATPADPWHGGVTGGFQSTLSMRRATCRACMRPPGRIFQSTLSMRRATNHSSRNMDGYMISIHALHEESDAGARAERLHLLDFNPRSP